jgi:superfamily II DNA/RNA helicase
MTASFADLGASVALVTALDRAGIATPFPVQVATLPDALAGRDVCAMAPTGSGKTLAYGIAALERAPQARPHCPSALVLVPTRELSQQVVSALAPMAPAAKRFVSAFYGGAGMMFQIDQLRRGVDIAVGTPGRLIDLMRRGELDLTEVRVVVVDEADRMADMGFMPQISELMDTMPGDRQVLLFSATLDGDVGKLVARYMNDPVRHEVEGQHGGEDEELLAAALRAPHYRVMVKHETKIDMMADLCRTSHRSIVFAKNRYASERMSDALGERGVESVYLHGGMSQSKRQQAVRAFSNGHVAALVATDLAARGLHVDGVSLVVHLDPPQDWKDYIHRSGRTARAGARGVVVNLLRRDQLRSADKMERELGVSSTTVDAELVMKELQEIPVPETKAVHIHVDTDDSPGESERGQRGARRGGERPRSGFGRFESRDGGRDRGRDGGRDGFRSRRPGFGSDDRRFGDAPRGRFDRGDRPGFDRDRPRFDSDRPRFDRDRPRSDSDRPRFDSDRPRFDRDRPRFDSDRPRFESDRPRTDDAARHESDQADRAFAATQSVDQTGFADRPAFGDRPQRGEHRSEHRGDQRGSRGRFDSPRSDRPSRDDRFGRPDRFGRDDRAARSDRPSFGGRGSFGERGRPAFGERGQGPRRGGFGERAAGDRSFGDRSFGERSFGDRSGPRRDSFDRPQRSDRPVGSRSRSGADRSEIRGPESSSGPRFAPDGSPLNRKARRAMQFGEATPDATNT